MYAAGQPMGAYSSWPAFALTHHIFILYAAHNVGINSFKDYRVLGDDVVIRNDSVAKEYLRLLDEIGVEVSQEKTLVAADTFEFAKRVFHKGSEVTAFPTGALCSGRITDILTALWESRRRGFPDLFESNPWIIADLLLNLRVAAWDK